MSDGRAVDGRLLLQQSGGAGWNMAVDQAIAESVARKRISGGDAPATLRFYTWRAPTLSLGYFQAAGSALPRFENVQRVRRSTGGGAIMHHHELTYSLVVGTGPGEHGARNDLYRGVHAAIVQELGRRAITAAPYHATPPARLDTERDGDEFLCFRRRTAEDIIVSGYKVLGSAQRRFKGSILQHGSLLLRSSPLTDELPGIFDLTSVAISTEDLAETLSRAIGNALGITFLPGELDPDELRHADRVATERFGNPDWWNRR